MYIDAISCAASLFVIAPLFVLEVCLCLFSSTFTTDKCVALNLVSRITQQLQYGYP